MQGGGQGFESPHLHHEIQARRASTPFLTGPRWGATVTRFSRGDPLGPPRVRFDKPTPDRPLITVRDLKLRSAISGSIADRRDDSRRAPVLRVHDLSIEEWKHRFRRGNSDATADVLYAGQHRASRVNAVGQATKSTRWMPWRQEPTKDVAGSEMLRGVASKR